MKKRDKAIITGLLIKDRYDDAIKYAITFDISVHEYVKIYFAVERNKKNFRVVKK